MTDTSTEGTEAEETFRPNEQGVAYSSESAPPTTPRRVRRPSPPPRPPAVARRLSPGSAWSPAPASGPSTVATLDSYFPNKLHQQVVNEPFVTTDLVGRFDVIARIHGGGITGQAGALRLGVARALNAIDIDANRPSLKKAGLLTRDARVIERKKAGLKKARKAPQYSKR